MDFRPQSGTYGFSAHGNLEHIHTYWYSKSKFSALSGTNGFSAVAGTNGLLPSNGFNGGQSEMKLRRLQQALLLPWTVENDKRQLLPQSRTTFESVTGTFLVVLQITMNIMLSPSCQEPMHFRLCLVRQMYPPYNASVLSRV